MMDLFFDKFFQTRKSVELWVMGKESLCSGFYFFDKFQISKNFHRDVGLSALFRTENFSGSTVL